MVEKELRRRRYGGFPEKCSDCPLRSIVLYAPALNLDTQILRSLGGGRVKFAPRQILARAGDVPKQVYSLHNGWAFQYLLLPDGRRQIFSFLLPGDFIGVPPLINGPLQYSVQSLTDIELCTFDTDRMADLFRDNKNLMERVTEKLHLETSILASRVVDLGRRTAVERVVRLILDIESRLRNRGLLSNKEIPFPLRQTHIADALGLTAVHVNRTVNTLRREGVITLGQGVMTIENEEALRRIGRGLKG